MGSSSARADLIQRVESHPLFAALRADAATRAALQATLVLYRNPQQGQINVPLFQLLTAPVENLRQRAERLAPQLAQAEDVEQAEVIASESCLGLAPFADDRLPSYAIELTPSHDVQSLEQRLRDAPTPVIGRVVAGRLRLDLRTVLARQDQRLVETIARQAKSTAQNSDQTAANSTD